MSAFLVTVRTPTWCVRYPAIADCCCDCIDAAIDQFGVATVTAMLIGDAHA